MNNTVSKFTPTPSHRKVEQFLSCHGFKFDWNSETTFYPLVLGGYLVLDSGHIDIMLHELGHVLASPDDRFMEWNFGLKLRKSLVMGSLVVDPLTTQVTEHEIKVACYQWVLSRYLEVEGDVVGTLESFQYLPDWVNRPRELTHFEWVCNLFRKEIKNPQYQIKNVILRMKEKARILKTVDNA